MDSELQLVNQAMNEYFDSVLETAKRLGPIHIQYYQNIRDYMMRGGKRLRPLLVVAGYRSIREKVDAKHLYRAACSMEFLHNGSLVHDDLIDHDETRRGALTVHALYREFIKKTKGVGEEKARDFGAAMAILSGDSVLNMGPEIINASELEPQTALRCLSYYQTAYRELADGVLLEMTIIQDPRTSADTYLDMIRMKTAALFEKSILMGAVIAGATQSQLDALSEYAIKVGQAFQVQDDILGSFGDESVTGKSVDGDIREGKKTMLVVQVYQHGGANHAAALDELLGKKGMSKDEVDRVRQVFRDSGALGFTEKAMTELLASGQKALNKAKPPLTKKYKQFLLDLSEFLVKRSY